MTKDTFRKRPGTTNMGVDYENYVIANLVLQLTTDPKIKNFKLSSNEVGYGSFDDIVVEIESYNETMTYLFQLKHKKKDFALDSLSARKGNFSILKYLESSMEIKTTTVCKYILFTNQKLDLNKKLKVCLKKTEEDCIHTIINKVESDDLLKNGNCYTFSVVNESNDDNANFFNNFFLCTNQPNAVETKSTIISNFRKMFSCKDEEAERYIQFISQWSNLDGYKKKLNKHSMQDVIALTVLSPFIKPLPFGTGVTKEMEIFKEAINCFDVTVLRAEAFEDKEKMWSVQNVDNEQLNETKERYKLINFGNDTRGLNEELRSKLLWLMGEYPLIVTESASIYQVIKFCQKHKFIIIGATQVDVANYSTFQKLEDLEVHPNIYKNLIENFKCSIQGKEEINLKSLIDRNVKLKSCITVTELAKMLKTPYLLGEDKEDIPRPYINRQLSINHINMNYLNRIDDSTLIVLNCKNQKDKISGKLGNFNLNVVDIYLREKQTKDKANSHETLDKNNPKHRNLYQTCPDLKKFVTGPDIYVADNECSLDDFEEICRRNPSAEKCHHLKVIDDVTLEWIRSKGDISALTPFRQEIQFLEETNLHNKQFENNLNLVNGDPRMVKSELLKNFKNHSPSNILAIFLQSKDITLLCGYLEEVEDKEKEFIKFIIDTKYENYSGFEKEVIKILIENHQVAYFWDALDEITTRNIDIIGNFIVELSQKSAFQWVTSRCHLKEQLEKKFQVLSRNIRQFNEKEQTDYIRKRLEAQYLQKDIDDIIEKIRNTVTLVRHNDVLGIPLQIFMLTELFRQDHKKYLDLLKKVFSLTDLYQHIIDQKFNRYYTEKADVQCPNDALRQVLDSHKQVMFDKYEKTGLKALIKKELFKELNINCDDFLKEIHSKADSIGLITEVTDNFPQFLHNSYAEFFVAKYFSEHQTEISGFEKIIFDGKYANIRFFYDLLTAEDSSAHIAVLYNNLNLLKQHPNNLNCEDRKGRNVLQIACSWGQRYPVLDVQENKDSWIIDNENDEASTAESSDYIEILQYLLNNYDFESNDSQNSNSLDYAVKADCLLAKLIVLLKSTGSNKLTNDREGITILYYCTKFGYEAEAVINLFEETPLVRLKKDNSTLLHLAVTHGHEQYLCKLLSTDVYKSSINHQDKFGKTALYEACQNGYYNLAKLLLNSGADINLGTHTGCTPLHTACLHAHVNIVELLLESGGNINVTKEFKLTPLHVACWNGHKVVVKMLLQNDAKINVAAEDGCTPLYVASRNKHPKVVKLLLGFGAEINLPQEDGVTPLLVACQEGHIENVELLLATGADVNLPNKTGETPFFLACQNGHVKVVEMLLKSEAAINTAVSNGWTPLHITCQQGHEEIVRLLKDSGADVAAVTDQGIKACDVAISHGHVNIVNLLKSI